MLQSWLFFMGNMSVDKIGLPLVNSLRRSDSLPFSRTSPSHHIHCMKTQGCHEVIYKNGYLRKCLAFLLGHWGFLAKSRCDITLRYKHTCQHPPHKKQQLLSRLAAHYQCSTIIHGVILDEKVQYSTHKSLTRPQCNDTRRHVVYLLHGDLVYRLTYSVLSQLGTIQDTGELDEWIRSTLLLWLSSVLLLHLHRLLEHVIIHFQ